MATVQVTNRVAGQTLRGQSVRVFLDSTETGEDLPSIAAGQSAVIDGTSVACTVRSVDAYGRSFVVTPVLPTARLESTALGGVLAVDATVTVTL